MTDRPPAFAVKPAPLSGAPGALVRGEIDIHTAAKLTAALDTAMRESWGAFVVDLCDVAFLDSSGVSVLVHARACSYMRARSLDARIASS